MMKNQKPISLKQNLKFKEEYLAGLNRLKKLITTQKKVTEYNLEANFNSVFRGSKSNISTHNIEDNMEELKRGNKNITTATNFSKNRGNNGLSRDAFQTSGGSFTDKNEEEGNENNMFGFNYFEDKEDDCYVIEVYNIEHHEPVLVQIQVTRRVITPNKLSGDVKKIIFGSDDIQRVYNISSCANSISDTDSESKTWESENEEYIVTRSNDAHPYCDYRRTIIDEKPLMSSDDTNNKKQEELPYIIKELIDTEETYIHGLKKVISDYKVYLERNSPDITTYGFGNIEEIYKNSEKFLNSLKRNSDDVDRIAQVFIEFVQEFELYILYLKNRDTANIYLNELESEIKSRREQLKDKKGLSHYLITPMQRLTQYKLLLERIQKKYMQMGKSVENINAALNVVLNVLNKTDNYMKIECIKNSPFKLSKESVIRKDTFNILKPKKISSMVLMFEDRIVFTQEDEKQELQYIDSIPTGQLILSKCETNQKMFQLSHQARVKKLEANGTFELEAETPETKDSWLKDLQKKTEFTDSLNIYNERTEGNATFYID